jgi:hypothetical protein
MIKDYNIPPYTCKSFFYPFMRILDFLSSDKGQKGLETMSKEVIVNIVNARSDRLICLDEKWVHFPLYSDQSLEKTAG